MIEEHFIFPLGTVLFPGGVLPLKIFEQRYLEMTKTCLRDNRPFGACLIKEGKEVGAPAVPHRVGCLATIESWEMPQLGMFELLARGTDRFRLIDASLTANGLMSATIERIVEVPAPVEADDPCREVLKLLIDRVGTKHFPEPILLDDAAWVSYRLPEILPLDAAVKQMLLETEGVAERLRRLRDVLEAEGLIAQSSP